MNRLRHPVRAIREPFGKAGLTIAILALVMAMVGGAYAAGGLTKSQEKQVVKIAKKYAGKPGANGTNGSNGAPGEKGATGAPGTPGANGTSVTNTALSPGNGSGNCEAGGAEFAVGTGAPTYACNGEGAGSILPEGKEEKGTWTITQHASENDEQIDVPINFPIPLAEEVANSQAVYSPGSEAHGCKGGVGNPTAEPGYFCVYHSGESNLEFTDFSAVTHFGTVKPYGGFLVFLTVLSGEQEAEGGAQAFVSGTWAVNGN